MTEIYPIRFQQFCLRRDKISYQVSALFRINFMSSEIKYDTVLITYCSFYSIFSHNLPNITQTDVYSIRSSHLLCPGSIVAIVENNE